MEQFPFNGNLKYSFYSGVAAPARVWGTYLNDWGVRGAGKDAVELHLVVAHIKGVRNLSYM